MEKSSPFIIIIIKGQCRTFDFSWGGETREIVTGCGLVWVGLGWAGLACGLHYYCWVGLVVKGSAS